MKKFPRRTRDPCRRSERTAKAASSRTPVRYIFYFAENVRRIRRAMSDGRKCENLPADDVIFVTIAPVTGSEYFSTRRVTARRKWEAGRRAKGESGFFDPQLR